MTSRIQLDSPRKNRLIGAIQSGLSIAKAARNHGIKKSTAHDIWKKFCLTGSTHNLPRSGRPKKVTARVSRVLIQESKKYRQKTLQELGNAMVPRISPRTIQRTLASKGLHWRKARKVVFLKKEHKRARLQWAKQYQGFTAEDWAHIIWSDECYVYLGDDRGTVWVTRSADEEY